MIRFRMAICISIVIFLAILELSYARSSDFIDNTIQLSGQTNSGVSINITVRREKFSSTSPYNYRFSWGTELANPRFLTTSVEIKVGGENVFVPLSAYSDLTNPRNATLEPMQNGLRLIIKGGQAATSYKAELTFEKNFIRRRKVTHGEFPSVAWEDTEYSFNVGDR